MAPSAVFLPCSGAVGEVFNKQYLIIQKGRRIKTGILFLDDN